MYVHEMYQFDQFSDSLESRAFLLLNPLDAQRASAWSYSLARFFLFLRGSPSQPGWNLMENMKDTRKKNPDR